MLAIRPSAPQNSTIPAALLEEEPGRKRMRSDSTASAPVFLSQDLTANPRAVDINDFGSDDEGNVVMGGDDIADYGQ
jgi:hypothetical protein